MNIMSVLGCGACVHAEMVSLGWSAWCISLAHTTSLSLTSQRYAKKHNKVEAK